MNAHKKRQNCIFVLAVALFLLLFSAFTAGAETVPVDRTSPSVSSGETLPSDSASEQETLPSASPQDVVVPHAIGLTEDEDEPKLFWGFVMWILVGVLIATVLAVILTAKTKAYRGGGKNRYSSGNKMGGQKHLLNEKYYQNRKRK